MLKNPLQRIFTNELIKFGIVGVANTLVDYGAFALTGFFTSNIYIAQTVGYAFGVLNSYMWNKGWTFKYKSKFFSSTLVKFIIVNLISYFCGLGALWLLVDVLGVNKYIAKILLIAVTFAINFTLNRFWVFRKDGDSHDEGTDKEHCKKQKSLS